MTSWSQTRKWPRWRWPILAVVILALILLLKSDIAYLVLVAAYFLPTIIAWHRRHQVLSVLLVNFFFGLTVVGWIIALIMSVRDNQPRIVTVIHKQDEGGAA